MRIAIIATIASFVLSLFWQVLSPEGVDYVHADQEGVSTLSIEISDAVLSAETGDELAFRTRIANVGSTATPELVVNLGFVSLDGATYVDPEDWSSARNRNLSSLAPDEWVELNWTLTPVIEGNLGVYVVVMPSSPSELATGPIATSPVLYLSVSEQRNLNPGGVLPVVLAVPVLTLLLSIGQRLFGYRLADRFA